MTKILIRVHTARRGKRYRGYLLMEAMVASAILAVVLGGVFQALAVARQDITRGAFRDVAVGLAHAKVSDLEANPSRATFAWTALASPGAAYPLYQWRWRLQNANAVEAATICDGANPLSTDLYSIEAEVSYPVRHASGDDMVDGLADARATLTLARIVR